MGRRARDEAAPKAERWALTQVRSLVLGAAVVFAVGLLANVMGVTGGGAAPSALFGDVAGDVAGGAAPDLPALSTLGGAPSGFRTEAKLAVVTVLRDFSDEVEKDLYKLQLEHGGEENRTHLMRMQLLHVSSLVREVAELNRQAGEKVADVVVLTPGGLLRNEVRWILRKGARLEVTDGGYEMRALWSLGGYERVLYLRPGVRFKKGRSLASFWKSQSGSDECILRAKAPTPALSSTPNSPIAAAPSADVGPRRRRLVRPSSKVSDNNPSIDTDKLVKLERPLVDWAKDDRMRPVLALWISPDADLFAEEFARTQLGNSELRFRPSSLDDCTSLVVGGYTKSTSRECKLQNALEAISPSAVLEGTIADGLYGLPIQISWKGKNAVRAGGEFADWLYGQLEASDAKACAKRIQVEKMSKIARDQVVEVDPRPLEPKKTSGRFANQAVVYKTHFISERVNKTLHSWAHSVNSEGGEVIAAVLGTHDEALYETFQKEQRRSRKSSYSLMHIDNSGVARNVIPFEATDAYARTCKSSMTSTLCGTENGKNVFAHQSRNTNRLMWLFTYANTMSIFKEILDSKPELEYLWLVDYDVTFTGALSTLWSTVENDDSDMLAVSFQTVSDPDAILKKESRNTRLSFWTAAAHEWRPGMRSNHVCAGMLRLSRRMMQWALDIAFTPLNWAVDEVFYFDACDRHKPRCKYTPFNLYGLVNNPRYTGPSYTTSPNKALGKAMAKTNGEPTNQIWHAIKEENVFTPYEPWLEAV